MAPPKFKQRERHTKAAYSASQPLFDALRHGTDRTSQQTSNLTLARNVVQHLHVQHFNTDGEKDGEAVHNRYMDCAVKAWQAATATYADIFEALADVTAAEPDEGRGERAGHAEFAEMARLATEANDKAREFRLFEDIAREQAEAAAAAAPTEDVEIEDDSSASESVASEGLAAQTSAQAQKEELKKKGWTGSGKERKWIKLDMQRDKRRKQKEDQKREELGERAAVGSASHDVVDRSAPKANGTIHPSRDNLFFTDLQGDTAARAGQSNGVKYEDVSAEVDARMKAKDEAREAKKKEKKRKRESNGTVDAATAGGDAAPAKEVKKARHGGVAFRAEKHKHKKRRADDNNSGGRNKKRKKSTD
ncbi:uncharacterized protein LTR77_007135 [Saxophila tyrrhenica]|uniref:Uncharacterized protein n=1 Tax=Saxophila tyrrhenica TaxID=1690608 RepID=A0AAV9P5S7_9PEZI|nr:hypothetical protein LTR77_007135 [Saxophila tyrrhenica]